MARLFRYLRDALGLHPKESRRTLGVLYADPSALSGVARLVDLMGVFDDYNMGTSGEEADLRALRSDWLALGHDMRTAMKEWELEQLDSPEREHPAPNAGRALAAR